jgi:hypothetical protein
VPGHVVGRRRRGDREDDLGDGLGKHAEALLALAQRASSSLALGDVFGRPDEPDQDALVVTRHLCLRVDPAHGARRPNDAKAGGRGRAGADDVRPFLDGRRAVVGVERVLPRLTRNGLGGPSDDGPPACVRPQDLPWASARKMPIGATAASERKRSSLVWSACM